MPYDPYNPYNYNPYPNPARPQQPQVSTYAFVNGLDGAKNYPVLSNQSMLLMDSTQSVCYLKSVNALGQMSLKCFRLSDISESDLLTKKEEKVAQNGDFATKEDIKAILERLEKLEPKKEGE